MRQIKVLAVLFALLPGIAAAQQILPKNTVWGRLGISAGPAQAIPIPTLFANNGAPAGPQSCSSHNWFNTLSSGGILGCAQPAIGDISGFGTGVATALGNNTNSAGGFVTSPVPYANIAAGTSDTALGYWGSTVASALAINNCSGSLTYSTSTHTFGCNNGAGSGTLTEQKNTGGYGLTTSGNCDNTSTNAGSPCNYIVGLTVNTGTLGTPTTISASSLTSLASASMGTSGTIFCTGVVTWSSTAASPAVSVILTDGTTKFAGGSDTSATGTTRTTTIAGTITNPANGISLQAEANSATATAQTNISGSGHDTQITCVRLL